MSIPAEIMRYPAPAKLNLDLRITGRRADGYHHLESIFCLIGLYDEVGLRVRSDGLIVLHTPTDGLLPEQDLAYRAAALLKQDADCALGADIWLDKRIPTGGGLGGGSSDAATVLMVLNRLWGCALSRARLAETGLSLGADVPFFIFGRSAFACGVGELLTEMPVPVQWYVVVKPQAHVSTAVIFSHQNLTRNSLSSIMPSFQSLQPFRNDMQAVVLEEYPEVNKAFLHLQQYGGVRMTGSGACLFLSFVSEEQAKAVYRELVGQYTCFCVQGLAQHPLIDF